MKICIIGGGSAGWLAALMLTKERPGNQYTLIESDSIGTIGVGEGTTGLFSDLIKGGEYGITVEDFIKHTDALPKLGIRFTNWKGDSTWFDSPLNGSYTSNLNHGLDYFTYTSVVKDIPIEYTSCASTLTYNNLTNFFMKENDIVEYDPNMSSYHFDANKLGKYLRNKLKPKLYEYLNKNIIDVNIKNDRVQSLIMEDGSCVEADIFIDASGLSRLISSKFNQEVIHYTDVLPCDRTFLFKLKDSNRDEIPNTHAHARDNGWIFEIPSRLRTGRGYIYCSKFASDDDIKKELEELYCCEIEHVKTIKFNAYRLKNVMYNNIVSIGLAASFFEPLQATSIHNTIIQVRKFIELVLCDTVENTLNPIIVSNYNKTIEKVFENTAAFIEMHYECGREDSDFWRYVKYEKKKSTHLKNILELANTRLCRNEDFDKAFGIAGYPLWNNVLAGIGYFKKELIHQQFNAWDVNPDNVEKDISMKKEEVYKLSKDYKFLTQKQLNKILNDKYYLTLGA